MDGNGQVPVVEVHDLVKRYRKGKVNAVDGVSFAVRRGEVFGLLLQTQRAAAVLQAVEDLLDAHVRRLPTLPLPPAAWTFGPTSPPTTPAMSPSTATVEPLATAGQRVMTTLPVALRS